MAKSVLKQPTTEQEVKRRIVNDLAQHTITTLKIEDLYRHYRCQKPGTRVLCFDIVTWPGYLAFVGDMGDYVFARTADMIPFMRGAAMSYGYAAEKCVSRGREGLKEFSERRFEERLQYCITEFDEETDESDGEDRAAERDELLEKIGDIREAYAAECSEHDAYRAMYESGLWDGCDFPSCEDYTFHFLWALHAIKWFCDNVTEE